MDKIWAAWQRDPDHPERLDPATTYGTSSGHSSITGNFSPWDGGTGISPWTNPGEQANKTASHDSVVAPPVYDTAPLRIPVLQPGESCVIQIPWFPPDPGEFGCFGDPGHFCLLARIETATAFPFGMTSPEGANVNANTRNNNNIAWKNLTVVDNVARLRFLSAAILRNIFEDTRRFRFNFRVPPIGENRSFFDVGRIALVVPNRLVEQWLEANMVGEGVEIGERFPENRTELLLQSQRAFMELPLGPGQSFPVNIGFELLERVPDDQRREPYIWELKQVLLDDTNEIVGGQTFSIDISKFRLVDREDIWAYQDTGEDLGDEWRQPDYADEKWRRGRAPLGFGDQPHTVVYGGPDSKRHTVYFRKTFEADSPDIYNRFRLRLRVDDGAVIYLNGEEIYRHNMPEGPVEHDTLADSHAEGLAECIYWDIDLGDQLPLKEGANVLAVEVHQASPDSDDLHFDLALCANGVPANLKPDLKIITPQPGDTYTPRDRIEVLAEALDQDGQIRSVRFLLDGEPFALLDGPPYRADLGSLNEGSYTLTAVATDDQNETCVSDIRLLVANRLPPVVRIVHPRHHVRVGAGVPIPVEVEVPRSPSAAVRSVALYFREGDDFAGGLNLVSTREPIGIDQDPPYQFEVQGLEPGIYMLQAGAEDEAGNVGTSTHVHLMVLVSPKLTVERRGDNLVIEWDPAEAMLQSSGRLGEPWTGLPNAESPLVLPVDSLDPQQRFFRAVLHTDQDH